MVGPVPARAAPRQRVRISGGSLAAAPLSLCSHLATAHSFSGTAHSTAAEASRAMVALNQLLLSADGRITNLPGKVTRRPVVHCTCTPRRFISDVVILVVKDFGLAFTAARAEWV